MMTCRQCGAEIKNGEIICSVCGGKTDEAAPSGAPPGLDVCSLCGRPVPHDAAFCYYCGVPRRFYQNFYPSFNLPRHGFIYGTKAYKPRRFLAAAAAAVVIAAVLLLAAVLDAPAAPVVYFKQGTVFTADLDSLKTTELSNTMPASDDGFLLDYYTVCSPDGRYLYYPERDGDSAAVYRRDLSADAKDPHAVVRIDRGIGYPFEVTPDNRAVYIKEPGGGLYVSDGKSKQKIEDGISYFELSADGTKLVYTSLDGDIFFADTLSGEKIASNATLLGISDDFSAVYYDKNGSLYEHKIGTGKHRITSNISGFIAHMDDGTVYYTKSEERTTRLDDILNDDMKEADSAMKQPDIADYQTLQPAQADGTTLYEVITDEEAYNAALSAFSEKLGRDEIRVLADTFTMDFSVDTLWAYMNGEETKVTDDFAYTLAASGHGLLVYKKAVFSPPKKANLSEIRDIDELYALFNGFQYENGDVYAALNGKETQIVAADTPALATDNSFVYAPQDGKLYYLDSYDTANSSGTLQVITVHGGSFSTPQTVDRGVGTFALDVRTNAVYYIKDMQNGVGNLYRSGVKIDSGVSPSGMLLSHNGGTLYYFKAENGGTLMAYAKGDTKRIAYGVSTAALINDRLVFIADNGDQRGGLYRYDNGRPRLIDEGVTHLIDTQKYRQPPGLDFLSPELLDSE